MVDVGVAFVENLGSHREFVVYVKSLQASVGRPFTMKLQVAYFISEGLSRSFSFIDLLETNNIQNIDAVFSIFLIQR